MDHDPVGQILTIVFAISAILLIKFLPDKGGELESREDELVLKMEEQKKSHPNETRTQQGGLIEEED